MQKTNQKVQLEEKLSNNSAYKIKNFSNTTQHVTIYTRTYLWHVKINISDKSYEHFNNKKGKR